jgi:polysaccharide biosynthesis/export protein
MGAMAPGCQAGGSAEVPMPILPGLLAIPSISNVDPSKPPVPEVPETTVKPPPEVPGEFQRFAAVSVGKVLPVFGANLFDKTLTSFAPVERAPVTADYVVGPGDEILLRVWGQVNLNLDLTVDRGGAIYIPQSGSVQVAGFQFRQLPGFLRTHLEQVFRNFDLDVNMGQLRSIQVFVVGQARRPGSYTVSSLSTLVNALFTSGGPTAEGSLRRIQLKREDRVITEFDVYDLLLRGDKSKDVRLLSGDVIYIPPAGSQAAVAGSVKNPAIYELKTEHSAGELVEMAGGLTQLADGRRATLERIGKGSQRQALEIKLDPSGFETPIENGDVLQILAIPPRFSNAVTLRGNVADPGRFPWKPGMRLRDIIPDRESLVTRSYWRKHNLEGFTHEPESMPPPAPVDPDIEVPVKPVLIKIEQDAPPINWSYAVVERRDPHDLSTELLPFSPRKLLIDNNPVENIELSPGDIVTIFSQADIRVPQAQQVRVVRLEGEINSAGIYTVKPGETLAQLVARAGGLTPEAYLYGAEFTRESTRKDQQAHLDRLIQDLDRELKQQALQQSGSTIADEDVARVKAEQENASGLIDHMRSIKATGRIVVALDGDQPDLAKLMEIPLEDGDVFMVPARPATVNVLGAVYNQNAFLHSDRLHVVDYLRAAGGATRGADKDKIFIIRADGSVVPRQGSGMFHQGFEAARLNPGDSLVVPNAFPRTPFLRGLRDWSQVFSQLLLGAAAVNVLK